MKLQHLAIIFIVILLPIILITSYYLDLQETTLSLQLSYDQKLLESAKDAMEAFEINTTEWNDIYSNLADSKRRDVTASINTFISSMANNLGISGAAKENILSYIPAVAFTFYDGFYVYAPAHTPKVSTNIDGIANINDEGNLTYKKNDGTEDTTTAAEAEYTYAHTLTNYLPYAKRYDGTEPSENVIVNYTLDNYVRVYSEAGIKAGNLVYFDENTNMELNENSPNIKYNNDEIKPETLTEKIILQAENNSKEIEDGRYERSVKTYNYIYDIQNEKYYYDTDEKKFFRVVKGQKIYLPDAEVGDFDAKYRKIVIYLSAVKIDVYELLNGEGKQYFVDTNGDGTLDERILESNNSIEITYDGTNKQRKKSEIYNKVKNVARDEDCSAINYYADAYEFTTYWNTLGISKVTSKNNPEKEDSAFAQERREVVKEALQKTLTASITQYAKKTYGYEYQVIQLSEEDWEQIMRNATLIAFFEGVPIGLKYYSNYAIATSTTNKEFINPDEIYFSIEGDEYYHSVYSNESFTSSNEIVGYKNTDYIRKKFTYDKNQYYYYLHDHEKASNSDSELACYECIVSGQKTITSININLKIPYYHALARERYVQNKDVSWLNGDLKNDLEEISITYKLEGGTGVGSPYVSSESKQKDIDYTIRNQYSKKTNTDGFAYWSGSDGNKYKAENLGADINAKNYGYSEEDIKTIYTENDSLTLTAKHKVKITYKDESDECGTQRGITGDIAIAGPEMSKLDYSFEGWYRESDNTNVYNNGDEINITENTTLLAKWKEEEKFNVSYKDKDENLLAQVVDLNNGDSHIIYSLDIITNKDFVPKGYKLIGWTEIKGSNTVNYDVLKKVRIDRNITLYPVFKEEKSLLKIVDNSKSHANGKKEFYLEKAGFCILSEEEWTKLQTDEIGTFYDNMSSYVNNNGQELEISEATNNKIKTIELSLELDDSKKYILVYKKHKILFEGDASWDKVIVSLNDSKLNNEKSMRYNWISNQSYCFALYEISD